MLKPRPLLHTATGLALLANATHSQALSSSLTRATSTIQHWTLHHPGWQNLLALEQTGLGEFSAHFDDVLGTSLDLVLHTLDSTAAHNCQVQIFAEIERLRGILSTYDPASEIRQVMAGASLRSPELAEVLSAYDLWSDRTGGAINVNLAGVIREWKAAEKTGVAPTTSALHAAHHTPHALNVDALGKGYIIDHVVAVARQLIPSGLLNIGGDIRAWGKTDWLIGIADPRHPADNAAPIATFTLRDAAVATSGGYARNFIFSGQRFSHLISPLTRQPLNPLSAATVVAPDCVTANALSSAACVLGAFDGSVMARAFDAAHLIWDASSNRAHAYKISVSVPAPAQVPPPTGTSMPPALPPTALPPTPAASTSTTAPSAPTPEANAAPTPWPKDFQVTIHLDLGSPQIGRAKRPYVAIWIVNEKNVPIRTVIAWGNRSNYWPELTYWWKDARNRRGYAEAVTRATRPSGKYTIVWDGKDDKGTPLPQGKYTVVLEINREHGSHAKQNLALICADQKVDGVLKATSESGESSVHYGPVEAPPVAAPPAITPPAR